MSTSGYKIYKRLLGAAKPYWRFFVLGAIGTILLSLTDASIAYLVKPIINLGFVKRNEHFIKWLPIVIIFIFIVRSISGFISSYFIYRVARSVIRDFRRMLFYKFLHLPASFF